jgi:hypothetical protein
VSRFSGFFLGSPGFFLGLPGRGLVQVAARGGPTAGALAPPGHAATADLEADEHSVGPAVHVEIGRLRLRDLLLRGDPVQCFEFGLQPSRELEGQRGRGGITARADSLSRIQTSASRPPLGLRFQGGLSRSSRFRSSHAASWAESHTTASRYAMRATIGAR